MWEIYSAHSGIKGNKRKIFNIRAPQGCTMGGGGGLAPKYPFYIFVVQLLVPVICKVKIPPPNSYYHITCPT